MKPLPLDPEQMAAAVALTPVDTDLDPSVRDWLRKGFARWLVRSASLEEALDFPVTDDRKRNQMIRTAAGALPGSRWQRAVTLAEWSRNPGRKWPGKAGSALEEARRHGALPRSPRQIWRILG